MSTFHSFIPPPPPPHRCYSTTSTCWLVSEGQGFRREQSRLPVGWHKSWVSTEKDLHPDTETSGGVTTARGAHRRRRCVQCYVQICRSNNRASKAHVLVSRLGCPWPGRRRAHFPPQRARVAGEWDMSCHRSWHHLMPSQLFISSTMPLFDCAGPRAGESTVAAFRWWRRVRTEASLLKKRGFRGIQRDRWGKRGK